MTGEVAGRLGIGVDLGATRIRVCVGDETGKMLWRKSTEMFVYKSVEDYVGAIVARIREGLGHSGTNRIIAGIGVASIGPLDLRRGGMASPANLPYDFVPIVEPLTEAFGMKVTLMNDASAAALGERAFGAGKDHENLVYVTISTGIGGGAIVDGHLLIGKDGNAAEVGHLVVDPEGRLACGCGRRGHWEAYCSGKNLPNLAKLLAHDEPTEREDGRLGRLLKTDKRPIDSEAILRAAANGNSFATRVAEEMGRLNALGVADLVNMFDPSLITMGGGVVLNNRELVLKPIRASVPRYATNRMPKIIITPLGDDAGTLGALSLALGE